MTRTLILFCLFALTLLLGCYSILAAQEKVDFANMAESTKTQEMKQSHTPIWKWSVVVAISGTTADWASSIGKYELNPLIRGSDGKFAAGRAVGVKAVTTGIPIVVQYLLIKRWPKLAKPFSYVNFANGGVYLGVAVRNMRQ